MREQVRRRLGYLHKLESRMQQQGWPADDPVYAATREAHKAMHALHVRLIYAGTSSADAGGYPLPPRYDGG